MKTTEIVSHLEAWVAHHRAIEEVYQSLHKMTGAMPDCALLAPVYRLLDAYTEAISDVVGDKEEWLSWYAWDNDMGAKKLEVTIPGKKPFKADSLTKLARCIK